VTALIGNLLHFTQLLRRLGLDVPSGATLQVATALEHIDIGRRSDVYFTLRALLVHRHSDLPIFDEAFRTFWRRPANPTSTTDLRSMGEKRRVGPPEREMPEPSAARGAEGGEHTEPVARVMPMSYSGREVLRTKDFAAFSDEEIREARIMLDRLEWAPDLRRTRRWMAAPVGVPDWRRLLSHNVRFGGELVALPRRDRRWRQRSLVVLCDVSGSMERYSRMLLHFVHGLTGYLGRVDAFLFATRLTRITHEMRQRGADQAVAEVIRGLVDWGGGTRIGEALRTFNVEWARRVIGRSPVVLLISDGWDRGEPEALTKEIARLSRAAHRLMWLNPLLGSPGYQPLTRGMLAALPYVDDFLPVHNLASLERLAATLNALPPSRAGRRRSGPASSVRPTRGGAGQHAPSVRPPDPLLAP
jgi:uncharacterized protein with von Willebrand factor type A (vWA) domain